MILTYKIRHEQNFERELALAKKVAEYGLSTKSITSKDVKHLGLKSAISNQILKKYSRNKKLQRISSVNLTIPSQSIKIIKNKIYIPCLKLSLDIYFDKNFLFRGRSIRKTVLYVNGIMGTKYGVCSW